MDVSSVRHYSLAMASMGSSTRYWFTPLNLMVVSVFFQPRCGLLSMRIDLLQSASTSL